MAPKRPTKFRFVDLFAGIGGIRLGFETAGGTCAHSVELDRFARQTYAANFETPFGSDIREVGDLPPHEVMCAGFPCQPFSLAGVSKKQSLSREHGFRDATHGTLFFELARLVDESRPPVVFFENVKNLLSHDGGRTMAVVLGTLSDLGYEVSHSVLDARYWVPQHRERVFIVGLDRERFPGRRFVFPRVPVNSPQLGDILEPSEVDAKYVLSDNLWRYLQQYAERQRRRGNGFGFSVFGPDGVARTLSARYHKDGSEILISRPGNPRRLTPRECARLMGFPEGFVIPVSDTQAYRQFGNSVVVPVVAHLARELVRQLRLRRQASDGRQMSIDTIELRGARVPQLVAI